MKLFFSLLLTYYTSHFQGFSQTFDSLWRELQKIDLPDSSRVDIWNELAFDRAAVDPKIGLLYADSALQLAQRISRKGRVASSHNSFGVNYWYLGEDSLALVHYKEVLEHHVASSNEAGQARIFNNLALLSYNRVAYLDALLYHERANEIFRRLGMTRNLVNSLSNTGVVFLAINDYPRALDCFLEALEQTDSTEYYELGNLNTNIGLVYKNMQDPQVAVSYHTAALDYHEKSGNLHLKAQAMGNLASIFQQVGKLEEAEELLNQSLHLNEELGNPRRVASDLANLAILYTSKGQLSDALDYYRKAADIYREAEDYLNTSLTYHRWADALLQNPGKSREHVMRARALLEEALEAARRANSPLNQMEAWKGLSSAHRFLGQHEQALFAAENYMLLKDSVFSSENEKKLVRIQAAFELRAREQDLEAAHRVEKAELEAEQRHEAFVFQTAIGILVFMLALAALFGYVIYRQKSAEKARLLAEFQAKKTELELKALRAQMNPHFIFNALSSISNFLLDHGPDKADYYLGRFAKLIRLILESSDQALVPLQDEVEILRHYIEIEAMRMAKPIHFILTNKANIDLSSFYLPPMLLQPLVENAIWHGISKVDRDGEVELEVLQDSEGVSLKIRDNGGGIQQGPSVVENSMQKRSMGIKLIQSRLELFPSSKKDLGKAITWTQLPQGLEVAITLPTYAKE